MSKPQKTFLSPPSHKNSLMGPKKLQNDPPKAKNLRLRKQKNVIKLLLSVNISKALKTFPTPIQPKKYPDRAQKASK